MAKKKMKSGKIIDSAAALAGGVAASAANKLIPVANPWVKTGIVAVAGFLLSGQGGAMGAVGHGMIGGAGAGMGVALGLGEVLTGVDDSDLGQAIEEAVEELNGAVQSNASSDNPLNGMEE